ncbi:helix-turn-helix domain-containing protein [Candidatus Woesearchaeota archaeon]|nr:helix-turn-helix domain-containing protein [Candidatus Woesearchaeota archaeon]
MWVARIKLRHDCILGNRCRKFGVMLQSYDLNEEKTGRKAITSSLHQMIGLPKAVSLFITDLRKDKRVTHLEVSEKSLFLVESSKGKPVSHFTRKMFFVKPVVIGTDGFEHWEIASHQREELMEFVAKVKPLCQDFSLLGIKQTKLKDIYFPKVLPSLTDLQKRSLELAIQEGYYQIPKNIGLRQLARLMKISLATYQKHLQKAEYKVMPDLLSYLK